MGNMRIFFTYFLIACAFLVYFFCPAKVVQASGERGHVYIVIMDRIALEDLLAVKPSNIMKLIDKGAIALMNTKVTGSRNPKSAYLTIGAGARAVYAGGSHLAFNSSEWYGNDMAMDRYKQYTGLSVGWNEVINLSIPQIIRNNEKQDHLICIGELGRLLRQWGIKAAVLGNEDTDDSYSRNVVSLIMDENGKVPLGDVSKNLLIRDISRPYSVKTDYEKLWYEVQWFAQQSGILIIQTGDTWRVDEFRSSTTDAMLERYRRQAIMDADAFIGRLMNIVDLSKDLIMVITPYPSVKALAKSNSLTPFIVAGKNILAGWATSATTKRDGVITNLDIAPTILKFFDIPVPSSMLGHAVIGVHTLKKPENLLTFNNRLVIIYKQRPELIQTFIGFQLVVLLTAFGLLQFKKEWSLYVVPFLYSISFVPTSFILMPLWQSSNMLWTVFGLIATTVAMTYAAIKVFDTWPKRIIVSSLLIASLIAWDLTFNSSSLMKGSALGYDVIAGSRYYGIGNEFMGVLIAASLVGTMSLVEKHPLSIWHYILPIIYGGIFYILIHPAIGTNVGGSIAAFIGFGVALILLWRVKINFHSVTVLATSMAAVLLIVFYMDSLRSIDMQSHIGQTIGIMREQGIASLLNIAARKLARNIYLIRYTIWSPIFIASFVILLFLIYRPVGILMDVLERYPFMAYGFKASIVASIVAFLVNDSGVVAAAMAMIYVAPFLIILIIHRYVSGGDYEY